VAEALIATLTPIQRRYRELTDDRAELLSLLRAGADAVAGDALRTVAAARDAMGLLAIA
jgi:tryptophanyl-tRNA synthetase